MELEDAFVFSNVDVLSNYLLKFEDMKQKRQFCDVTIRVLNRSFSAHRVILAAGIPYFREVFTNHEEISLTEICPSALESLIEYAYRGKVTITFENARSLLAASAFLQLTEVTEACFDFLKARLSPKNALKIRNTIEGFDSSDLIKLSNRCIQENFGELSQTEEFLSLPFSCLESVLEENYVNVESEESIFEAVIKWVKVSAERQIRLPELLRHVRLSHLNLRYLVEQVAAEELVRTSIPCRDLIDEAKNCHLLPSRNSQPCAFKTQERHLGNRDRLYVVINSKTSRFTIKEYNVSSKEWTLSANCPQIDSIEHIVSLDNTLYIFGDQLSSVSFSNLQRTSISSDSPALLGACVVSHQHKIYVFDSAFCSAQSSVVHCFDPANRKWSTVGVIPAPRLFAGIVSVGDHIYILGGHCNGSVSNSMQRYDPRTNEWDELPPMLTSRYRHCCATQDGKIYACGGYVDYFALSITGEVYDPCLKQWRFIRPMRTVGRLVSLVSCNQKIYAIGEYSSSSPFKFTLNFDIYDCELDEWKAGGLIHEEGTFSRFAGAVVDSHHRTKSERVKLVPSRLSSKTAAKFSV